MTNRVVRTNQLDADKTINVGEVSKIENEYFCYMWKINNFYDCLDEKILQSENFTTGDESIWYLKISSKQIYSYQNFDISLDLILKSCKATLSNVEVRVSVINENNVKTKMQEKLIKCIDCNYNNACKFMNLLSIDKPDYMVLYGGQITIICEIFINSRNQIKIIKHNKTDDLKDFLLSEKLSDVTLVVGDIQFHVHKAILASRSPVLLAMFENNMIENNENKVLITDIDSEVMKVVILYIYTDEIENLQKTAISVLPAAEKYSLEGLKFMCGEVLSQSLTVEEAFQTLVLADTYNVDNLKKKTLNFIIKHLTEMINMKEYNMLKKSHSHLIEEILVTVAKKTII